MARYTLGTDIPIVWTLDTRGLSGSLASYNLYFEYYTGTGRKRVSGFTIDGSVLSWTFPGSEQIAYGQYGLRLVVADSHQGTIAEYKLDNAFELIHGIPSQQAEPQMLSSSLEIDATESPEPTQPGNDAPAQYASPSPLYLEKIPLGSNIVLNWNLLTAGDFDFDLAECDIKLYYSASGSGRREAEDYELLTENGYVLQWRFAGVEQIRYGLYSLFLEVYQSELLIAVLEREYAFELTHRNGSDILVDRIISFESYVTSLGGGALFSLYDVLNNGHSTVYRGDGITPAAAGDLLIFGGNKWNAIPAGGIGAIQALGEGLASLQFDVNGLVVRVGDTEGNLSTLTQRADSIELRVSDAEGNIGDLELTSTALAARMSNAEGDLAVLELTAGSLTTRISNAEGDIGSLELTASSLTTRISNAEGDVTSLQQTATSLSSRVSNAEGDISVLTQTATGLQYQVNSQYGDIATLKVTARGLTSRVSNAEGDISVLEQTATSLISRITDAEEDISTLTQTANRIELAVQAVDSEVTRYEGVTDAALASMQDQIDGVIETWYFNGVPTLSTPPVMSSVGHYYNDPWLDGTETPEERAEILNNHIGDLYYDKDTGKAYRFMLDSTENPAVYKWVELADEDIAKALALAGEKKRVFVVTPFAPYDVGDLWVRSRSVGSDTTSEIWRCKTSRAADASPGFLESEWESADNYGYVVNKSNLEVLSNKIVGQVTEIQYNQDGTITSQSAGLIEANARSVRLATVVDNVALAGITIDATNHTGSVTIFSDNFFIKDGSHTKTALAITHDSQGNSLIDVTSLNVAGIFTTSVWLGVQGVGGERNSILSDAETNAETYATSSAYLTGHVVPLINSATAGLAVDSDYSYLKTALGNQTTALGGLLLTSLIQLGATESGGSWTVRAGISGVYDTTKLGNGIAAWYGGPMTDWKSLTEQQRLTTPFAKSLFRMDGSGYLASGEIQWGSAGDIILHGVGIESAALDEQTTLTDGTTTFTVEDLILLRSWFSIDYYLDSSSQRHYYLKLNASGSDGTAIEGFVSNGFISAGGISSGGGSTGTTLPAVWASIMGNSDEYANDKINAYHIPIGSGLEIQNGVIVVTAQGTVTGVKIGSTTYTPSAGSTIVDISSGIPTSMAWSAITSTPTTLAGYGITDAKIESGVITLGGSTITPLTSHQTIYALTIKNSGGTTELTYTPNSGAGSITLTKGMVGLGNVENTALSTWAGSSNITTLGTITTGTWNGSTIGSSYLPSMYIGRTAVAFSAGQATLLGIDAISNASSSGSSDASRIVWDSTNNAWHFLGNVYADGFISAGGLSPGGGTGGIDPAAMWAYLTNTSTDTTYNSYKIHTAHLPTLSVGTGLTASYTQISATSTNLNLGINATQIASAIGLGNYLPLTGGTISSTNDVSLSINSTHANETDINIQRNGAIKTQLGFWDATGTVLYDFPSGGYINIPASATTLYWKNANPFYHSGNSNKSDVAWTCQHISAVSNGTSINAYGASITSSSNMGGTAAEIGVYHEYGAYLWANDAGNTAIQIGRYTGTTRYNLLLQPFGGNVGIGTASPAYKLDVNGSIGCSTLTASGDATIENSSYYQKVYYHTPDATMKMYVVDGILPHESVAIQTCFDSKDPETSTYATSYPDRCVLALQPRGGYVGIGTASPAYKLDVSGSLNATTIYQNGVALGSNAFSSTAYLPLTAGTLYPLTGALTINVTANAPLILKTPGGNSGNVISMYGNNTYVAEFAWRANAGTYMYNHTAGKQLGIKEDGTPFYGTYRGTTYALWHAGNSNKSDVAWTCSALVANGYVTFYESSQHTYRINLNFDGAVARIYACNDAATDMCDFKIGSVSVGNSIYYKGSTGNVGIGTASPGAKLEVASTSSSVLSVPYAGDGLMIHTTGNAANNFALFCSVAETTLGTVATPALVVRATGNVGIGTSSPGYKLEVNSGSVGDAIRLTSTTTYSCIIYTPSGSGKNWSVGANNDGQFYLYSNTAIRAYFTQAGNFVATGAVTAGEAQSSSDARLKANIRDFENPIRILKKLRAREWDWNGESNLEGHCAGLVAQEIEPYMPYVVGTIKDQSKYGSHLVLNYNALHGLEIAALQNHESRIDQLERENKELRREIERLNSERNFMN